jgi:hypothetical protein
MPRVPALQIRDPISLPVLMEPYNLSFSHTALSARLLRKPKRKQGRPRRHGNELFSAHRIGHGR